MCYWLFLNSLKHSCFCCLNFFKKDQIMIISLSLWSTAGGPLIQQTRCWSHLQLLACENPWREVGLTTEAEPHVVSLMQCRNDAKIRRYSAGVRSELQACFWGKKEKKSAWHVMLNYFKITNQLISQSIINQSEGWILDLCIESFILQ